MSLVLGIDIGTQSVKAVIYDAEKKMITASAARELSLSQRSDGSAEQHPDQWLDALAAVTEQLCDNRLKSVAAVAVSGQQHGFVAIDKHNHVLAPAKLWCDTATVTEAEEIMARMGGADRCIDIAGNPILVGYTASKILHLKQTQPDRYSLIDSILLPHDYINLVLSGERSMECGDASGTGLLDIRTRSWSQPMLDALDPDRDIAALLPTPRQGLGQIGTVTRDAAARFGLPQGIPVATGGGDNMMAAIGTGATSPGRLTMSLGTSGTVFAYSDAPVIDPRGEIAAFCSSTGGWMPLMCTMNCSVTTELLRGLFGTDIDHMESAIASAPAGANGVTVVPFFGGERTPNLPDGRGSIMGLTNANFSQSNLLRAGAEGASFALQYGVDRLKELGIKASEITLTGGGSGSASWRQMIADICDVPTRVCAHVEGAAFGAALQALQLLEPGSSIEDIAHGHIRFDGAKGAHPNMDNVARYQDYYQRYQDYVSALRPLYKAQE